MKINWKEIKEKYPKTYNLFLMYFHLKEYITGRTPKKDFLWSHTVKKITVFFEDVCYCDLEKFFRNNMIIITYHYSINGNGFKCFIYNRQNNYEFYSTNIYIDKEDSENEAIKNAFEIKEEELNNGLQ